MTTSKAARRLRTALPIAVFVLGFCVVAGCRSTRPEGVGDTLVAAPQEKPRKLLPWQDNEPKVRVPAQIVATWTNTVLQQTGQSAKRGFGGRLFFYPAGSQTPTAVDGQLVVYAFDETDRSRTDNKPTKRYVFPPEQMAHHRSESELGLSYSFWLPWDDANGQQKDVSLIARFEPVRGGALVVSDQSRVRLPGELRDEPIGPATILASKKQGVQTASHESDAEGEGHAPPGVETTTIRLPSGHRLSRPKQSDASASKPSGVRTTVTFPARAAAARP